MDFRPVERVRRTSWFHAEMPRQQNFVGPKSPKFQMDDGPPILSSTSPTLLFEQPHRQATHPRWDSERSFLPNSSHCTYIRNETQIYLGISVLLPPTKASVSIHTYTGIS